MSLPGLTGEPSKGDSGAIRALAAQYTTRATALRARAENGRNALASLTGVTADFADSLRTRIAGVTTRFDDGAKGCDEVATVMNGYAASLDTIRADAANALQQAQSDFDFISVRREQALDKASEFVVGWAVAWDQTLPSWLYLDNPSYLARWERAIEAYQVSASAYNALTSRREDLDTRTAGLLRAVSLFAAITDKGGVPAGPGRVTAVDAWAGSLDGITAESLAGLGDPDVIRQVWDAMGEKRRDKMIEDSPEIIGNLDGLPIGDRARANNNNIENEIDRLKQEAKDLQEKFDNPALWAGQHPRVAAQKRKALMDEIDAANAEAASYQALLDQKVTWIDENGEFHTDNGARVIVFDPTRQGIATYQGPIDPATRDVPAWIKNVVIHVPGTGTNIETFGGPEGFGKSLYSAAGGDTAVFVWAGGPLPQTIPEATSPSFSQDLGPKLRDFREGIAVPRGGDLVVTGHSYGGAVVGLAEQAGLRADRVLYIAGAGMGDGVSGVKDFPNTSDVPHYSMQSRNEVVVGLIQDLPMHGQSPIRSGSGVIRLETGFTDADDLNSPDIESTGPIESHSSLMRPGSTSFENIVGVVQGTKVELYAEDRVDVYGRSVVVTDGIDRSDYKPNRVDVK